MSDAISEHAARETATPVPMVGLDERAMQLRRLDMPAGKTRSLVSAHSVRME